MDLEKLFSKRAEALKEKNFSKLCQCAIEMAENFSGPIDPTRLVSQEVAFFLGRINDRSKFEDIIYRPYLDMPPSLREIRSFEKEEKMYDMGTRYPFLNDEELDYLENLYCSSDTYDMISRILYDADDVLRRKLARFDERQFNIKNEFYSKQLCLDIMDAFIRNDIEFKIQEAIEERYKSVEDKVAEADFWGRMGVSYDVSDSYSPILVYNRRSNSIQIDQSDLSDRFLIPISNFHWAKINLIDAIELYKEHFGKEFIETEIFPVLNKCGLNSQMIEYAAFCSPWFIRMESYIIDKFSLSPNDTRLLDVREKIARKWLKFQNEKSLR